MGTKSAFVAMIGLAIVTVVALVAYFTPTRYETLFWLGMELLGAGVGLVLLLAGTIGLLFKRPRPERP